MSITAETAQEHAKDPAVLCCRAESGTVLSASNLEDPNIFPDLEESGLLTIPDNVCHIGEVIGATLKVTADSLVALTPDMLDGLQAMEAAAPAEKTAEAAPAAAAEMAAVAPVAGAAVATVGGSVRIHIGEGKNIDLEFPLGGGIAAPAAAVPAAAAAAGATSAATGEAVAVVAAESAQEPVKVRELRHDHLKIENVVFGDETKIEGTTLTILSLIHI